MLCVFVMHDKLTNSQSSHMFQFSLLIWVRYLSLWIIDFCCLSLNEPARQSFSFSWMLSLDRKQLWTQGVNVGGWPLQTTKPFKFWLRNVASCQTLWNSGILLQLHFQLTAHCPIKPESKLESNWGHFILLPSFYKRSSSSWRNLSLKCDLNPVFRRKGALLWPPLHPSPHFHPPCLGQRMKALKRLSTSSLGPDLMGLSKAPLEPFQIPLLHLLLNAAVHPRCCMSCPRLSDTRQRRLRGAAEPGILWTFVYRRETCVCDAALLLCSSHLW